MQEDLNQSPKMRRGLVAAALLSILILAGCGGTTVATTRPPAPKAGDTCTNNGATFTYNDGGPGYVEQTAFGLTCQAPAPPAPAPAPAAAQTTTQQPAPAPAPVCRPGFAATSWGGCADQRHLPCPAGYSGWQNTAVDNCLENES